MTLRPTLGLTLALTAISSLGFFSTMLYLPSIPAMAVDLDASAFAIQMSLTAYLVVFAGGQLLHGPLSDRFGRRPLIVGGLLALLAGSAVCALADTAPELIAGRIVQAAGGGACLVAARALIRDAFEGRDLSRMMGYVAMASAIVPAVAPPMGGLIEEGPGWPAGFVLVAVLSAILIAVAVRLPESRAASGRLSVRGVWLDYRAVLASGSFVGYSAVPALMLAGIYGFMAGGAVHFITRLGVSPAEFGVYPAVTVVGFLLGVAVGVRLIRRTPERRLVRIGAAIALLASFASLALIGGEHDTPVALTMAVTVYVIGMALVLPFAAASALRGQGGRAGTAAAVLGAFQAVGMSVGPLLTGALEEVTAAAYPIAMIACTTAALLVALSLPRAVSDRGNGRRRCG